MRREGQGEGEHKRYLRFFVSLRMTGNSVDGKWETVDENII